MYYSIFLDGRQRRELRFYEKLLKLQEGEYTLHTISQLLEVPYNLTVSFIEEIATFIEEEKRGCKILLPDRKVKVHRLIPAKSAYFKFIVKESIPFKLLLAILTKKHSTIENFCQSNYTSLGSVRRKVLKLREYLAQSNIRIKLASLDIVGDERLIRLALQELIWVASNNEGLPLNNLTIEKINEVLPTVQKYRPVGNEYLEQRMRKLFIEITYLRASQGYFVNADTRYREYPLFHLLEDLSEFQQLMHFSKEKLMQEAEFMAFLTFYGPTFFIETDPLLKMPLMLGIEKESHIALFLDLLDKKFFEKNFGAEASLWKLDVLKRNLLSVYFNYYIFKTQLPMLFFLENITQIKQKAHIDFLYLRISNFVQELIEQEEFSWMKQCQPQINDAFFSLIIPTFEQSFQKLNVSIFFEGNYLFLQKVEAFISSLEFVQYVLMNEENKDLLDVIICSSEINDAEFDTVEKVIFPLFFDSNESYAMLYDTLLTMYRRKFN